MAIHRPLVRDAARQAALAQCLFGYRDLSDDDLARIVDFLRSDSGGRYARGASAAQRDAMLERAQVFTSTLIEVMREFQNLPKA